MIRSGSHATAAGGLSPKLTTTDRRDTTRSGARELHPPKVRGLFLFTTADQVTLDNPTAALASSVWCEPRDESHPVALLA